VLFLHKKNSGLAPFYLLYSSMSENKVGRYLQCIGNHLETLAARGLKKHHVRITLIFSRIISFMLFTVLLSLMKNF